jgi:hypothetical protein
MSFWSIYFIVSAVFGLLYALFFHRSKKRHFIYKTPQVRTCRYCGQIQRMTVPKFYDEEPYWKTVGFIADVACSCHKETM